MKIKNKKIINFSSGQDLWCDCGIKLVSRYQNSATLKFYIIITGLVQKG